jgi:hypothetical protein
MLYQRCSWLLLLIFVMIPRSQLNFFQLLYKTFLLWSVHPRYKHDVGYRLSRAGLAIAYGQQVEFQGPIVKTVEYSSGSQTVNITYTAVSSMELRNSSGFEAWNILLLPYECILMFYFVSLGLLSRIFMFKWYSVDTSHRYKQKWFDNNNHSTKLMCWKTIVWSSLSLARNPMSIQTSGSVQWYRSQFTFSTIHKNILNWKLSIIRSVTFSRILLFSYNSFIVLIVKRYRKSFNATPFIMWLTFFFLS